MSPFFSDGVVHCALEAAASMCSAMAAKADSISVVHSVGFSAALGLCAANISHSAKLRVRSAEVLWMLHLKWRSIQQRSLRASQDVARAVEQSNDTPRHKSGGRDGVLPTVLGVAQMLLG